MKKLRKSLWEPVPAYQSEKEKQMSLNKRTQRNDKRLKKASASVVKNQTELKLKPKYKKT